MRFYRYDNSEQRIAMRSRRRRYRVARPFGDVDGDVRGFGPISYGSPSLVGGVLTAEDDTTESGFKWGAVATGVMTGIGIWFATALLDRLFPKLKK